MVLSYFNKQGTNIFKTIKYKNGSNEAVSTEFFSKSSKLSPSKASSEIKYKREKLQYDNIRVSRACTRCKNIFKIYLKQIQVK